jgi:hypothetical protein
MFRKPSVPVLVLYYRSSKVYINLMRLSPSGLSNTLTNGNWRV